MMLFLALVFSFAKFSIVISYALANRQNLNYDLLQDKESHQRQLLTLWLYLGLDSSSSISSFWIDVELLLSV